MHAISYILHLMWWTKTYPKYGGWCWDSALRIYLTRTFHPSGDKYCYMKDILRLMLANIYYMLRSISEILGNPHRSVSMCCAWDYSEPMNHAWKSCQMKVIGVWCLSGLSQGTDYDKGAVLPVWWFETLSRPLWRYCNGPLENAVLILNHSFSNWHQDKYLGHFFLNYLHDMMTSSNGDIFRVTGHLCGEFTGFRWNPRTKASDAELWCFLWSAPG